MSSGKSWLEHLGPRDMLLPCAFMLGRCGWVWATLTGPATRSYGEHRATERTSGRFDRGEQLRSNCLCLGCEVGSVACLLIAWKICTRYSGHQKPQRNYSLSVAKTLLSVVKSVNSREFEHL